MKYILYPYFGMVLKYDSDEKNKLNTGNFYCYFFIFFGQIPLLANYFIVVKVWRNFFHLYIIWNHYCIGNYRNIQPSLNVVFLGFLIIAKKNVNKNFINFVIDTATEELTGDACYYCCFLLLFFNDLIRLYWKYFRFTKQ